MLVGGHHKSERFAVFRPDDDLHSGVAQFLLDAVEVNLLSDLSSR